MIEQTGKKYVNEREESTLLSERQQSGSCKCTDKINNSSKTECSELCAEYRKTSSNEPQTSGCKPQALRESFYRQKKPETKPTRKMLPFARLKTKVKETSRKLQKTTEQTVARVKSACDGLGVKRVLGFKCDLKTCGNTLKNCSAGPCRKSRMIFGELSCPINTADSRISDDTRISMSEDKS